MRVVLFSLLLAGMLLFGCTGGGGEAPSEGGQSTAAAVQQGGGDAGGQAGDLSGQGYAELAALGTPVECTVSMDSGTMSSEVEIKMKGGKYRYDSTATLEETTMTNVAVFKDGVMYVKVNPRIHTSVSKTDCAWMKFASDDSEADVSSYGGVSSEDLEDVPPINWRCRHASFGDEAFATPGKACSQKDLMQDAMGGIDPCAQIMDPSAKAGCEEAMADLD